MKLVIPSLQYKQAYLDALEDAKDETSETKLSAPEKGQSFASFVSNIIDQSHGENLPEGYVPASTFWLVDNERIIGRVQIRHILTEKLEKIGGHIGYYIRPSERGKGYGTALLRLSIEESRKMGLKKVLITCDDTNIASQKIIKANGGKLHDCISLPDRVIKVRRYWIPLPS